MLNSTLMSILSTQLTALKGVDEDFGGINVIFVGDFCQLPTTSGYDLWKKPQRHFKDSHMVARGHKLWRSQNAVVVLDEQMRQTDDYVLQDLLRALRYRKVEERHLELLRSRIARTPEDIEACGVIIVRRNKLRHALNDWMLHRNADRQNVKVLYSIAHIGEANGMSEKDILAQRANSDTLGDSVLALIPDAPLVITDNLDVEGGKN